MDRIEDREDTIDLGVASVETQGGVSAPIEPGGLLTPPALTDD